jgi:hypothetical protein
MADRFFSGKLLLQTWIVGLRAVISVFKRIIRKVETWTAISVAWIQWLETQQTRSEIFITVLVFGVSFKNVENIN